MRTIEHARFLSFYRLKSNYIRQFPFFVFKYLRGMKKKHVERAKCAIYFEREKKKED